MEASEIDVQLDELENRLERLRALYEQYFMGIEKLEPSIPRKDVDRRIWFLRREKIRNTAKRFKLQTLIQRYNTFQQYWQRICREIENGTYKRHLIRAEKKFGNKELLTIASRRRLGRAGQKEEAPAEEMAENAAAELGANAPASAPPASAPPAALTSRSSAAPPGSAPPRVPPPPPRTTPAVPAPPGAVARAVPPPVPGQKPLPPPARAPLAPPPRPVRPPAVSPPTPAPTADTAATAPARPQHPPPPRAPATPPPKPGAKFESLDLDMDFLGDWDPAQVKKPGAAQPDATAKPETAPKPAGAQPAQRPARQARPAKPADRAAPKPAPAPLNEDRIRELQGKLNELKKQNREAGQVSYDGLAKSLKATEEKLRRQHGERKIDFDVVLKDGKAVLKPIIR